ncbi:MAG: hypothetical protein ACRD88_02860, partial [Terriglobia bacterium]
ALLYSNAENGYLVFIEPSRPVVRRWFKKINASTQISKVADALDRILMADPEIQAVRWWTEDEKGLPKPLLHFLKDS